MGSGKLTLAGVPRPRRKLAIIDNSRRVNTTWVADSGKRDKHPPDRFRKQDKFFSNEYYENVIFSERIERCNSGIGLRTVRRIILPGYDWGCVPGLKSTKVKCRGAGETS